MRPGRYHNEILGEKEVAPAAQAALRWTMATDNPVPPRETDEALFKTMPASVQRLDKQARKELRQEARKQYQRTHATPRTAFPAPSATSAAGSLP
jgi:diketogulonate reductase-like aldo/keto reductase